MWIKAEPSQPWSSFREHSSRNECTSLKEITENPKGEPQTEITIRLLVVLQVRTQPKKVLNYGLVLVSVGLA